MRKNCDCVDKWMRKNEINNERKRKSQRITSPIPIAERKIDSSLLDNIKTIGRSMGRSKY